MWIMSTMKCLGISVWFIISVGLANSTESTESDPGIISITPPPSSKNIPFGLNNGLDLSHDQQEFTFRSNTLRLSIPGGPNFILPPGFQLPPDIAARLQQQQLQQQLEQQQQPQPTQNPPVNSDVAAPHPNIVPVQNRPPSPTATNLVPVVNNKDKSAGSSLPLSPSIRHEPVQNQQNNMQLNSVSVKDPNVFAPKTQQPPVKVNNVGNSPPVGYRSTEMRVGLYAGYGAQSYKSNPGYAQASNDY